jgi:hypothetical protein
MSIVKTPPVYYLFATILVDFENYWRWSVAFCSLLCHNNSGSAGVGAPARGKNQGEVRHNATNPKTN